MSGELVIVISDDDDVADDAEGVMDAADDYLAQKEAV